jgi:hypothetical protein
MLRHGVNRRDANTRRGVEAIFGFERDQPLIKPFAATLASIVFIVRPDSR